jgi:ankyrin repeat protein
VNAWRHLLAAGLAVVLSAARAVPDEDWVHAVSQRDLPTIERLLPQGANVNLASEDGKTALMLAAGAGQRELVHALLAAGADVNFTNRRGGTALMYAATSGDPETVALLLSHGAAVNAKAVNGWTAVTLASAKGYSIIVRRLLDAGADANAADLYGWTPLMRAVEEDRPEVVRVLLQDKSVRVNARDDRGETALHHAAAAGSLAIARLLIVRGADTRSTDMAGRTPAMVAKAEGHAQLADFLRRSLRR